MKRMALILLCPLAVWSDELWLQVGQVKDLPAKPGVTVRVSARGLLRVVETERAVRLIGLKPGTVTVAIESQAHTVHVSAESQLEFYRALAKAIRSMQGLKLRIEGAEPVITGTLLRFSDWLNLAEISRAHRGRYQFAARALDDVGEKALVRFRQLAENQGFPILRFSADPQFTVHIPASSSNLNESIEAVFAPFGISIKSNSAAISVQPLIKTQVILAEVSRSQGQVFGVEWPSSYEAQLMPRLAGSANNYMLTLKALAQRGHAQILASPNLLCRSGGEARFLAGGEFPVPVVGRHSKNVIWKQHGVILNVKPKADFQGAISLEIETEVSLVDMAHAVDGVPALKTNKVKSHFDLAGKRTIALSGLLRQELGHNQEGLPILSDIPILGPLFSSRSFQAQQSELVIFVTPEIHTPAADAPIEMPKGWIQREW